MAGVNDVAQQVAANIGMNTHKDDVAEVIKETLKVITEMAYAGDSVIIKGFGTFVVKETAERNGRNPQTGAALVIPAKRKLALKSKV